MRQKLERLCLAVYEFYITFEEIELTVLRTILLKSILRALTFVISSG